MPRSRPQQQHYDNSVIGDWYVYDGSETVGPLSDREIREFQKDSEIGRDLLVSRPGFRRWYPINEFNQFVHLPVQSGPSQKTLTQESAEFQDFVRSSITRLEGLITDFHGTKAVGPSTNSVGEKAAAKIATKYQEDLVKKIKAMPQPNDNIEANLLRQTLASVDQAPINDAGAEKFNFASHSTTAKDIGAEQFNFASQSTTAKDTGAEQFNFGNPSARAQETRPANPQNYLALKGRLRLGAIRSPFMAAWFYLPLTFGLYWYVWYRTAALEVGLHLSNQIKFKVPFWLCLVPGIHLLMTYKLAKIVAATEKQNNYSAIKPIFAAFLSLIPPLAIQYIQAKMNLHWRLHVKD